MRGEFHAVGSRLPVAARARWPLNGSMKRLLPLCLPLLAACASTAHLDQAAPLATFHSASARTVVAKCLLDRLSGSGVTPQRTDSVGATTVRFTSTDQWTNPGLYLFTIRDDSGGSVVEARMPRAFAKRGLPTAETCF
jgi:hypothetical protein